MSLPSNNCQIIFLDQQGRITSSEDNLFATTMFTQASILSAFPFVESIFQSLSKQATWQVSKFDRIKTIHPFLPGLYDYTFVKLPDCKACENSFVWMVFDKTKIYEELAKIQQVKQETTINKAS
ncbi:MAG: hypothetical protein AB8G15_14020 [Saprospiraceae bacterium]